MSMIYIIQKKKKKKKKKKLVLKIKFLYVYNNVYGYFLLFSWFFLLPQKKFFSFKKYTSY